jgi:hypothetical protein
MNRTQERRLSVGWPHGLVYCSLCNLFRNLLVLDLSGFFFCLQFGVLFLGDATPIK